MSNKAQLSNFVPFAGSGLLGYTMGLAPKKVLKWMLIVVGFLAGGVLERVTKMAVTNVV